jgi:hypothetical protein
MSEDPSLIAVVMKVSICPIYHTTYRLLPRRSTARSDRSL